MSPNCILLKSKTVIGLSFKNDSSESQIENTMKAMLRKKSTKFQSTNTSEIAKNIFLENMPINISFKGSKLQTEVWTALLDIPIGETASYSDIAQVIGYPKAVRTVATAIGQNPIAWLIPCHRIIRKSGNLGGYRWGLKLKRTILSNERN